MHYPDVRGSKNRTIIKPKPGFCENSELCKMGQRQGLSPLDVEDIQKFYDCESNEVLLLKVSQRQMEADVAKLKNRLAEHNSKLDRILEKFVQIETLHGMKEEFRSVIQSQSQQLTSKIQSQSQQLNSKIESQSQKLVLVKNKCAADVRRLDAKDTTFATKSETTALSARTALIENKPRFAAQIGPSLGYYLSVGYITDYDELIDVGNNFNPSTGVFTVGNKEEDQGTYVFLFSGYKIGGNGKKGRILVYKNGIQVQYNYETDASHSLQMNDIMSFNLKKGDEIKLYNDYDDSIYVSSVDPFTFTGYKI